MILRYITEEGGSVVDTDNPQFKSITKIEVSGEGLDSYFQYYGSTRTLTNFENLNKYGWEYYVKQEVDKLSIFTDEFKEEVIGSNVSDIQKFRDCLVVTDRSLTEPYVNNIEYFGTISSRSQTLLMFGCKEGYNKVTMYDRDSKVIEVTFEEDKKEIDCKKIIWLVTTEGDEKEITDINLSFLSCKEQEDPFRNMKNHVFREDRLNIIPDSVQEDYTDLWFDKGANVILGNVEVTESSFLDKIKNNALEKVNLWSEYVVYKLGDTTTYDSVSYTSLVDNNSGNNPLISDKWATSACITSYLKERGYVLLNTVDPISGDEIDTLSGVVSPGSYIKEDNNITASLSLEKEFVMKDYSSIERLNMYKEGNITSLDIDCSQSRIDVDIIKFYCNLFIDEETLVSPLGSTVPISIDLGEKSSSDIDSIKLVGKLGTDEVVSEDLSILSESDTSINTEAILGLPCDYYCSVYWKAKLFTITLIDYVGFYINKLYESIETGQGAIFKLAPISGDLNIDVELDIDGYNLTFLKTEGIGSNPAWERLKSVELSPGLNATIGLKEATDMFFTLSISGSISKDINIKANIINEN